MGGGWEYLSPRRIANKISFAPKILVNIKTITNPLIPVNIVTLFNKHANTDSSFNKPDQKLSTSCRSKVMDNIKLNKISEKIHTKKNTVRKAPNQDFGEMQAKHLNHSITMLQCSPVKLYHNGKTEQVIGERITSKTS